MRALAEVWHFLTRGQYCVDSSLQKNRCLSSLLSVDIQRIASKLLTATGKQIKHILSNLKLDHKS